MHARELAVVWIWPRKLQIDPAIEAGFNNWEGSIGSAWFDRVDKAWFDRAGRLDSIAGEARLERLHSLGRGSTARARSSGDHCMEATGPRVSEP